MAAKAVVLRVEHNHTILLRAFQQRISCPSYFIFSVFSQNNLQLEKYTPSIGGKCL